MLERRENEVGIALRLVNDVNREQGESSVVVLPVRVGVGCPVVLGRVIDGLRLEEVFQLPPIMRGYEQERGLDLDRAFAFDTWNAIVAGRKIDAVRRRSLILFD